jgi:hypothetical protein
MMDLSWVLQVYRLFMGARRMISACMRAHLSRSCCHASPAQLIQPFTPLTSKARMLSLAFSIQHQEQTRMPLARSLLSCMMMCAGSH